MRGGGFAPSSLPFLLNIVVANGNFLNQAKLREMLPLLETKTNNGLVKKVNSEIKIVSRKS